MATAHDLLILIRLRNEASRGLKQLTADLSALDAGTRNLQRAAIGATVALAGVATAVTTIGINFNRTKETAQVALTALIRDGEKAAKVIEELTAFATVSPVSINSLIEYAKYLSAVGVSADNLVPLLKTITAASFGDPQKFEAIALAIGQIFAKGKVQAEELTKQLANAGVPALQILAEGLGKTTGQIFDEMKKGTLDHQRAIEALVTGMRTRYMPALVASAETLNGMVTRSRSFVTLWSGIATGPIFDRIKRGFTEFIKLAESPGFRQSARDTAATLEAAFNKVGEESEKALSWLAANGPRILDEIKTLFHEIGIVARTAWQIASQTALAFAQVVGPPIQNATKWVYENRKAILLVAAALVVLSNQWMVAWVGIAAIMLTMTGRWTDFAEGLPTPVIKALIQIKNAFVAMDSFMVDLINRGIDAINVYEKLATWMTRPDKAMRGDFIKTPRLEVPLDWKYTSLEAMLDWREAQENFRKTAHEAGGVHRWLLGLLDSANRLKAAVNNTTVNFGSFSDSLEDNEDAAKKAQKELEEYLKFLDRFGEELARINQRADELTLEAANQLGDLLEEAIRRQLGAAHDATMAIFEAQRILNETGHKERLKQIDRERDAAVASIQAQIDALDQADVADRMAELRKSLLIAWDPREADKIQKEITALERDQQRERLRDQMREVERMFDERRTLEEEHARFVEEQLRKAEKAAEDAYKAQTTEAEIQKRVRELLVSGELSTIQKLLEEFVPEWKTKGLSYGEQLIAGLRESGIEQYLNGLLSRMTNLRGIAVGGTAGTGTTRNPAWDAWITQAAQLKAGGVPEAVIAQLRKDFEKAFPGTPAPFAHGGVVNQPTLALIGEKRQTEIVSPERLLRQIIREEGGGNGNVVVHFYVDGQELRGITRIEIERDKAQSRRNALLQGTNL